MHLIIDTQTHELQPHEHARLTHPAVCGIILFARHYQSLDQLKKYIDTIKNIRSDLLITIDQEGGRVQRIREPLTRIPPMATLGETYDKNPQKALALATEYGYTISHELKQLGIDINFAPILDLGHPESRVIGDRAFHQDPEVIVELATAFIQGMRQASMPAIGKHFPGHGSVVEDSHLELPTDSRDYQQIEQQDLIPFKKLIQANQLEGVMMSHVIYPKVDKALAGFSREWIQEILRNQLQFKGLVFTDDLTMKATDGVGTLLDRVNLAKAAGCDIALVCNASDQLDNLLAHYSNEKSVIPPPQSQFEKL